MSRDSRPLFERVRSDEAFKSLVTEAGFDVSTAVAV
jgi:hypothetical protein